MHRSFAIRRSTWACLALLAGCASPPTTPVALVPKVDLPRFMGDWYVIASIPTPFERGAHNAKESYRLLPDGSIDTVFTFNAGSFDGPDRRFTARGFVRDPSGAVWGERYVWPFEADYRISYLSPDYTRTVITREKRDYAWVMARTPSIAEDEYRQLAAVVAAQGYDATKLRKVPQQAR